MIPTPSRFHFWRTVYSHGWCALEPFRVNRDARTLERVCTLSDGSNTLVTIRASRNDSGIDVASLTRLSRRQAKEIETQMRAMLRLDEDLAPFYRHVSRYARYRWIPRLGVGRLLRAPTVFQDVVKMLCTTNCSWDLTTSMVTNLTNMLGEPLDGRRAFPTPEAIAGVSESFLRKHIRAGYRSPYLLEFARRVASGSLTVEAWRTADLPTDELYAQVRSVKGAGEYAAGNILRLLGRYDYLALDSWVRGKYSELYHGGRRVSDTTIARRYREHGRWQGLILWLEMTRDWFSEKFPF